MMPVRTLTFDTLPLFATDAELAEALLGKRACAWKDLMPLYERRGFPKIDPVMGGRYTPAVKAFFDVEYGLTASAPKAPPGVEKPIKFGGKAA